MTLPHINRPEDRILFRRLRTVLLIQLLLVFAIFMAMFFIVNAIFVRQQNVSSASTQRFEMALDIQTLERYMLQHTNFERSYRLTQRDEDFQKLVKAHQDIGVLLESVQEDIKKLPPHYFYRPHEEIKVSQDLEHKHAEIMALLTLLTGRVVSDITAGHTHSPVVGLAELSRQDLEARLLLAESQVMELAIKWRQFIQDDLLRLNDKAESYSRWRFAAYFGQSLLIVLVLAGVSYLSVLPTFWHVLSRVVKNNSQLKQVDSLKTEFLAVASHQLRTPLSELKWALTLLERSKDELSRHRFINQSLTSIDTMTQIVSSLLNVSRIEQNRLQFDPKSVSLSPIIKASVSALRRKAKDRGVTVTVHLPSGRTVAMVDVLLAKQILQNLINNGIQYNRPDGKVYISLKRQGHECLIEVSDTGHGIPPKDLKHIFTKFYRGDTARKLRPDGSGLGLYFVKKIVERHNGKIWIESTLEQGTKVSVTLPVSSG